MESKQEMNLYPQSNTLPGAPPQYNTASAPPQQLPTNMVAPQQDHNVYVIPGGQMMTLGPQSCRVTCPSCHQTQMTKMEYVSSTKTHIIALILCLTTLCCCIPYCIDSCKSAQHTCSNCGAYLGTYQN